MPPKKWKGLWKRTQPEPDPGSDVRDIMAEMHPVTAMQDDSTIDLFVENLHMQLYEA